MKCIPVNIFYAVCVLPFSEDNVQLLSSGFMLQVFFPAAGKPV
jgi:hypothetical protein